MTTYVHKQSSALTKDDDDKDLIERVGNTGQIQEPPSAREASLRAHTIRDDWRELLLLLSVAHLGPGTVRVSCCSVINTCLAKTPHAANRGNSDTVGRRDTSRQGRDTRRLDERARPKLACAASDIYPRRARDRGRPTRVRRDGRQDPALRR